MDVPKYAELECERRWLIAPATRLAIDHRPSRLIEDWYLDRSHLRLRRESTGEQAASVWKLCKKYGDPSGGVQPIVNVYLDVAEYDLLRDLPGRALTKRRYTVSALELIVVDVFQGELAGLRICEVEAETQAAIAAFCPPSWAGTEITADGRFSGGALAGMNRGQLRALLTV